MSAKKSWDIQPKSKNARQGPVAKPTPARIAQPKPAVRAVVRKAVHKPPSRSNERLRDRRKKQRRTMVVVFLAAALVLIFGSIGILRLPSLRISAIHAQGPHEDDVQYAAHQELDGSYAHIIPMNSIFFFSTSRIRSAILIALPDVEAVSISRDSFSSIIITPTERSTAFLWCGEALPISDVKEWCYDTDSNGLIFAEESTLLQPIATDSPPLPTGLDDSATIKIYAALDTVDASTTDPIRSHVIHAESIPNAILFTKTIAALGARVTSVVIRQDEADLYVVGGARITYVLGHEVDAAALAEAVLPKITITDGTIAYLDLRFSGKAYIQRVGSAGEAAVNTSSSTIAAPTATPTPITSSTTQH